MRHIPPGSDAVIHHDSENQLRSRISQALTFLSPLHCCILSLPLYLLFNFPRIYFYPASRSPRHLLFSSISSIPISLFCSISLAALKCNNISFTESHVSSLSEGCSPENPPLFLCQYKRQSQMNKCTRMR